MSASINTILILGGTGGIGEAFARRFHAAGKKVIITGRRQDRLSKLKSELPGSETYQMDNSDLSSLQIRVQDLISKYPDIDTIWINGGIQYSYSFKDPSTFSDEEVYNEIDTNATGPVLLARHFIPWLLSKKTETNFMITSSGLAIVPSGSYPVYAPTKSFVHAFMVGLRQQMQSTNVNVIEIAPPYVATELDSAHKDVAEGVSAMPLQEYTEKVFEILDNNKAKDLKEVAVGFAANAMDAWRGSVGGILEAMGAGG